MYADSVYDSEGVARYLISGGGGLGAKTGLYFIDQLTIKPQITNEARCITSRYTSGIVNRTASNSAVLEAYPVLTPDRVEKRQNGRRMKDANEPMFTLTTQDKHGVAIKDHMENFRIRRLTPRECFRLQGFPDELFDKARAVNSDAQLYKQAGNAVTVNVAYAVGTALS